MYKKCLPKVCMECRVKDVVGSLERKREDKFLRNDFGRVLLYVISCEEMKREKCWEEILREFCYGEEVVKKYEGGKRYL